MRQDQTSELEQTTEHSPRRGRWKWWLVPVAVVAAIAPVFYFRGQSLDEHRKLAEELKALADPMAYKEEIRGPSWYLKLVEKCGLSLPKKPVMLILHTATDEDMTTVGRAATLRDLRLYHRTMGSPTSAYMDELVELKWCNLDETHRRKAGMRRVENLRIRKPFKPSEREITDAGLAHLKGLRKLQYLQVAGHKITGAGLVHLSKLTELRYLSLYATEVNYAALAHLCKFSGLEKLSLTRTKVTDTGLAHLKKLENLDTLDLHGTQVTDEGLVHLKPLKRLTNLGLSGTKATFEGIADLKAAIPNLEVTADSQ